MATLFEQWKDLIENQTDETFEEFWKVYSDTESRIYTDLLNNHETVVTGTFKELAEKWEADPVIFEGFLDGVDSSLNTPQDFMNFDETSEIKLDIDYKRLFFNMLAADAEHLATLDAWTNVLTEDEMMAIIKDFKKSKTVTREEAKIGRNDPCPCGSGKKYKKCCGKNN